MGRNKTVLCAVVAIAAFGLLAGMQIAGASPKTGKTAQKEAPRAHLVLSYGTLTADKLVYKYLYGQLFSVHAYGHVKLEVPKYRYIEINGVLSVFSGSQTKYKFIATSREALFKPSTAPAYSNSLLHLVGSPNGQADCHLDGTVTMGDDAQYRYDEHFGKYVMHSGWVNVGWFSYEPGDGPCSDTISYPTGRERIFAPWPHHGL